LGGCCPGWHSAGGIWHATLFARPRGHGCEPGPARRCALCV